MRRNALLGLVIAMGGCTCPAPPCPEVVPPASPPSSSEPLFAGSGDPYVTGPLTVRTIHLARCEAGAPVELEIHAPAQPGRYAVVQFQHGFLLANHYYSQFLRHLASHGFIVVAPQMYEPGGLPIGKPSAEDEAALAAAVLHWGSVHLSAVTGLQVDAAAPGLAGHSRGGKVAWLMLRHDPSIARAVAGVDPVDGTGGPLGGQERVTGAPFDFSLPALVFGAGLGGIPLMQSGMSCAPEGDNHEQFYAASASPAWHVVAPDVGHLDLLDDELPGCGIICGVCTTGLDVPAARTTIAGLLTAFFRASLQGDVGSYDYLSSAEGSPLAYSAESK